MKDGMPVDDRQESLLLLLQRLLEYTKEGSQDMILS